MLVVEVRQWGHLRVVTVVVLLMVVLPVVMLEIMVLMVEVWLAMLLVMMVSIMVMMLMAVTMLMVVLVADVGSGGGDCGSRCCNRNDGISIEDHYWALRSARCMSSCLLKPWLGTKVVMDWQRAQNCSSSPSRDVGLIETCSCLPATVGGGRWYN